MNHLTKFTEKRLHCRYDPTAYGIGVSKISVGLNDSVEGANVVLTVPSGVADPGSGNAPWGIGYELDLHNHGQNPTVNPLNPSGGAQKYIGALNACATDIGFWGCTVGSVFTGDWPVAYNVTNGAGRLGGFLVDSTASSAGTGFWDQLGGNALSYSFQEKNQISGSSDANYGITREGETQSGNPVFSAANRPYIPTTGLQMEAPPCYLAT